MLKGETRRILSSLSLEAQPRASALSLSREPRASAPSLSLVAVREMNIRKSKNTRGLYVAGISEDTLARKSKKKTYFLRESGSI